MTLALLCGNNSLFGGYSGHVGKGGNNAVLTYYMMAGEGLGGWGGMYGWTPSTAISLWRWSLWRREAWSQAQMTFLCIFRPNKYL